MALNDAVLALQAATQAGTTLVFGYLGGGEAPFAVAHPRTPSCWPSAPCRCSW